MIRQGQTFDSLGHASAVGARTPRIILIMVVFSGAIRAEQAYDFIASDIKQTVCSDFAIDLAQFSD